MNIGQEKHVSICSDSQVALKAIQTAKTSPLVQCQKVLNDISTQHTVAMYWVPGHAGMQGNEIADRFAKDGYVHKSMGPEPSKVSLHRTLKRR